MAEQRSIEQIEASLDEWAETQDFEGFIIYVSVEDVRGLIAKIRTQQDALADLKEYALLMKTRLDQV
jgi:hypothetical protein